MSTLFKRPSFAGLLSPFLSSLFLSLSAVWIDQVSTELLGNPSLVSNSILLIPFFIFLFSVPNILFGILEMVFRRDFFRMSLNSVFFVFAIGYLALGLYEYYHNRGEAVIEFSLTGILALVITAAPIYIFHYLCRNSK